MAISLLSALWVLWGGGSEQDSPRKPTPTNTYTLPLVGHTLSGTRGWTQAERTPGTTSSRTSWGMALPRPALPLFGVIP